jgi:transmembrane sensor
MKPPEPDQLHARAEAAAWVARLRGEDRSAEDERAFQNWLRADHVNAAAFETVNAMWDCTGSLPIGSMRPAAPTQKKGIHRRALMASGIGAIFAGSGLFYARSAQAGVYQTEVGEQKHISLSDGSQLLLDTDTKVKVSFDDKARGVELRYGRVNCRVTADAGRPFALRAGAETVVGQRSTFDVCRRGENVSVVLISGLAAIQKQGVTARSHILNGGERLVSRADRQTMLDKPALTPLLAWQSGKAIFENSELAQAVYEMNLYTNVKIHLTDERLGHLKVSGVYRVGDNIVFARSLEKLLPVGARQFSDHIEIDSDSDRIIGG